MYVSYIISSQIQIGILSSCPPFNELLNSETFFVQTDFEETFFTKIDTVEP